MRKQSQGATSVNDIAAVLATLPDECRQFFIDHIEDFIEMSAPRFDNGHVYVDFSFNAKKMMAAVDDYTKAKKPQE